MGEFSVRSVLAAAVRAHGIRAACRASGVPRPTVMNWLRGDGQISLSQAEALARAVGLSLGATPHQETQEPQT